MRLAEYAERVGLGQWKSLVPADAEIVDAGTRPTTFVDCLAALHQHGASPTVLDACIEVLTGRRLEQTLAAHAFLQRGAFDKSSVEGTTLSLWNSVYTRWEQTDGGVLDWSRRSAWDFVRDESLHVANADAAFEDFALGAWGNPALPELREFAATAEGQKVLVAASIATINARLPQLATIYARLAIEANPDDGSTGFLLLESLIEQGASYALITRWIPSIAEDADLGAYSRDRIALRDDWFAPLAQNQRGDGGLHHAIEVLTTTGASRQLSSPLSVEDWPFGNVAALASKLRDSADGKELADYQRARYLDGAERAWLLRTNDRWAKLLRDDTVATIARVPSDRSLWKFLAHVDT